MPMIHADWMDADTIRRQRSVIASLCTVNGTRPSAEILLQQICEADAAGNNLSGMLMVGHKIVGCIVARRVRKSGEASDPRSGDDDHISIDAVSFAPSHRHLSRVLICRMASVRRERADLRCLPIRMTCTTDVATRLRDRPIWSRLGLEVEKGIEAMQGGTTTNSLWMSPNASTRDGRSRSVLFYMREVWTVEGSGGTFQIGIVRSRAGWDRLAAYWNDLLAHTPGSTVFQTFEFQQLWWSHIGWGNELRIIVVLRNNTVAAILPLQKTPKFWLGREVRVLSFIANAPDNDRPKLLLTPSDSEVPDLVAHYLVDHLRDWDHLAFVEQDPESPFHLSLRRHLQSGSCPIQESDEQECLRIRIAESWESYLASRPQSLRKSLKRKQTRATAAGVLTLEMTDGLADSDSAFRRYIDVERSGWKSGTAVGAARSPAIAAFYRELLHQFSATGATRFSFLHLDRQPIAATFGLVWNDTYYSLHISHDSRFDPYSPGVLLTALEIKNLFETRTNRFFDFLTGTPANKRSWANDCIRSRDLYATRPTLWGLLFHLVYYCLKPEVKRWMRRTPVLYAWVRLKAKILGRHVKDPDPDE